MSFPDRIPTMTYMPGEFILREGAKCDSLLLIKEGQIEIFRTGANNKRIPVGLVQSGEYLGEMSLITERPHSANAVVLTKTVCLKISGEVLEKQLKTAPDWLVALTRGLVFKLHRTNEVLKRNRIIDDTLSTAVKAIMEKKRSQRKRRGLSFSHKKSIGSSSMLLSNKIFYKKKSRLSKKRSTIYSE